ncbi:hypothetical protein DPMN_108118 [Dreissena polymorpha]|uniref:Uncharacterized protein n=1 Tax=Dreissena polymorpha TaxID=45954 RepID=A0A9D4K862_DREPO|nr:hypothetical protein DPMN_108118 [Dreissena polymorpha]
MKEAESDAAAQALFQQMFDEASTAGFLIPSTSFNKSFIPALVGAIVHNLVDSSYKIELFQYDLEREVTVGSSPTRVKDITISDNRQRVKLTLWREACDMTHRPGTFIQVTNAVTNDKHDFWRSTYPLPEGYDAEPADEEMVLPKIQLAVDSHFHLDRLAHKAALSAECIFMRYLTQDWCPEAWFGFTNKVRTFNKHQQEALTSVPESRLLLESDAPDELPLTAVNHQAANRFLHNLRLEDYRLVLVPICNKWRMDHVANMEHVFSHMWWRHISVNMLLH